VGEEGERRGDGGERERKGEVTYVSRFFFFCSLVGLDDVCWKQILWPTFHYSTVRKDETTNWEDYVKVNEAFAEKIVETVRSNLETKL